jgi:hypothetical protein
MSDLYGGIPITSGVNEQFTIWTITSNLAQIRAADDSIVGENAKEVGERILLLYPSEEKLHRCVGEYKSFLVTSNMPFFSFNRNLNFAKHSDRWEYPGAFDNTIDDILALLKAHEGLTYVGTREEVSQVARILKRASKKFGTYIGNLLEPYRCDDDYYGFSKRKGPKAIHESGNSPKYDVLAIDFEYEVYEHEELLKRLKLNRKHRANREAGLLPSGKPIPVAPPPPPPPPKSVTTAEWRELTRALLETVESRLSPRLFKYLKKEAGNYYYYEGSCHEMIAIAIEAAERHGAMSKLKACPQLREFVNGPWLRNRDATLVSIATEVRSIIAFLDGEAEKYEPKPKRSRKKAVKEELCAT